jgi:hypothetical protein
MELNKKDIEKINRLIVDILEERRIETQDEWEEDFSKEHDFECLLEEFEKYLTILRNI